MKKSESKLLTEVDTTGFQLSGYVQATNQIRAEILHELGATPYVIYETILSHKNFNSITAYPSIELIAREVNLSKRTVEDALKKLVNHGFLLINSGKQGINNNYYFPKEPFHEGHQYDMEVQMAHRRKKCNNQYTKIKNKP